VVGMSTERDRLAAAALDALNRTYDEVNARPLLDAQRDRLIDKACDLYNKTVDAINARYPDERPLGHQ
jgi:hypothetical protein